MHRFDYWLVAGGGALGTVARYWLSGVVGRRFGETFPYGTLLVNVSGCLVIGFFATYTGTEGRLLVRPEWRLAFMAGGLRRLHDLFFFQPANAEPDHGRRLVPGRGERHSLGCPMSRRSLGGPPLRGRSQPVTRMEIPHEATLLRVFIGESDRHENRHSTKRSF